jgi:hypothetical protein
MTMKMTGSGAPVDSLYWAEENNLSHKSRIRFKNQSGFVENTCVTCWFNSGGSRIKSGDYDGDGYVDSYYGACSDNARNEMVNEYYWDPNAYNCLFMATEERKLAVDD